VQGQGGKGALLPGLPGIRRARWAMDPENLIRCDSGAIYYRMARVGDHRRCGDQEVRYFLMLFCSGGSGLGGDWRRRGARGTQRKGERQTLMSGLVEVVGHVRKVRAL
jgi:hypothetical protein